MHVKKIVLGDIRLPEMPTGISGLHLDAAMVTWERVCMAYIRALEKIGRDNEHTR